MFCHTRTPTRATREHNKTYSIKSCASSSRMKRRSRVTFATSRGKGPFSWPTRPAGDIRAGRPSQLRYLADRAREAGRDAPVGRVDRGAQLLQADDAGQRDECDEQRVLHEILALVLTHEP